MHGVLLLHCASRAFGHAVGLLSVERDETTAGRSCNLLATFQTLPHFNLTFAGLMLQGADLFYKKQEPRKLFPEQKRAIDEHAARLMQGW